MLPVQIRCYHENAVMQQYVFYILSKGNNAGRPAFKPWANCFIAICPNQEMFDFYFWLCYGLFQTGKFKMYHRGSVINFVNISDVQSLISEMAVNIHSHWQQYRQTVESLSKLEKRKATLVQQLISTERLQVALIDLYFNKKGS